MAHPGMRRRPRRRTAQFFLQGTAQKAGTIEFQGLDGFIHRRNHGPGHPGADEDRSPPVPATPLIPTLSHKLRLTEFNERGKLFLVKVFKGVKQQPCPARVPKARP